MEIQERALDRHQEAESKVNLKNLSELNLSKINKTLKLIEEIKGRMKERDSSQRQHEEYTHFVNTEYIQTAQAFDAEIERMTSEMDGIQLNLQNAKSKVMKSKEVLDEMTKKEEVAVTKRNEAENAHKTVQSEQTLKVQEQKNLTTTLEEKSEFLMRFQNEIEGMAIDSKSYSQNESIYLPSLYDCDYLIICGVI